MTEDQDSTQETRPTGGQAEPVRVLSCINCQAPVANTAGACPDCGTPLSGKEFPYIVQRSSAPDIPGLIKWWLIWTAAIWALSGFSFGIGSSIMFTFVSMIYLVRILRAYYR